MRYITKITLLLFSNATINVTQLALPFYNDSYNNVNKIILECSDGSTIEYLYKKEFNSSIGDIEYADRWNSNNSKLFGHTFGDEYYYFVAYSEFQMSIYNSFKIDSYSKEIDVYVQNGYMKWVDESNYRSNIKKLIAKFIDNGVIVPVQDEAYEKLYNFDYMNIIEVIKKVVVEGVSPYYRVDRYDDYINSEFEFKSAISKKDIPEKKFFRLTIVTCNPYSDEEVFTRFTLDRSMYGRLKTLFMKMKLLNRR